MKRFFGKIKNKMQNSGSGLILVIVALAFVGILVGALLTAAAFVYRLKLIDYNAKSNFYVLEQAMDEIYAGVGTQSMTDMQEAYQETREKIVYYDVKSKSYKNIGNKEANKKFKDTFMSKVEKSDFYNIVYSDINKSSIKEDEGLIKSLKSFISNDSVELIADNIRVQRFDQNGNPFLGESSQVLSKVVICNVTLRREADYNRNAGSSLKDKFVQTISSDIEICRPDFEVNFNSNNIDIDQLFTYCMVADSGVEINENQGSNLMISGNIFAANDFYNKTYNRYDDASTARINKGTIPLNKMSDDGTPIQINYDMNKVYNRDYGDEGSTTLRNMNAMYQGLTTTTESYKYDGNNDNSKYSGLYINGANVSILADYVVVPGSISVMNAGDLSLFGRDGSEIGEANVWADEVVLGGYVPQGLDKDNKFTKNKGASAYFDANMYIKDDTQIESNSSSLKLDGGYYGYSNSITSDNRVFVPTTKKDKNGTNIYQEYVQKNDSTVLQNRGHYNSSSILINSKNATIDMSGVTTLYIGGRSYVEVSHKKTGKTAENTQTYTDAENNWFSVNKQKDTYSYNSKLGDYRTGESISIKSSQLAYIPEETPKAVNADGDVVENPVDTPTKNYDHYECAISSTLGKSVLFQKYFGKDSKQTVTTVPVVCYKEFVTENGEQVEKLNYYIDFDYVSDKKLYSATAAAFDGLTEADFTADFLKQSFIKDYFDYMDYADDYRDNILANIPDDVDNSILVDAELLDVLKKVTYYTDHIAGQIALPNVDNSSVFSYSSGVLTNTSHGDTVTTTAGTTFSNGEIFKVNDKNETRNGEKIEFNVITAKDSVIESTLLGSNTKAFNSTTTGKVNNTINFSNEYQEHYNYVKWALIDLEKGSDEANVVDEIVSQNGEGCITPLNKFMNYNYITEADAYMPSSGKTNVNPNNLDLGSYKTWVCYDDVYVDCKAADNNTVTGIIVSKGDVYFPSVEDYMNGLVPGYGNLSKTEAQKHVVNKFNGIVITGGKIYVNNSTLSSFTSTDLCKNIINSCITKASQATMELNEDGSNSTAVTNARKEGLLAMRVLSVFKAYDADAESAYDAYLEAMSGTGHSEETGENENPDSPLSISNIDYSDIIRYNNWKRNVD